MTTFWIWAFACLVIWTAFVAAVSWSLASQKYYHLVDAIEKENNENAVKHRAQTHRIRTQEADPNRQTRVRTARLRAKKTTTPPPRN